MATAAKHTELGRTYYDSGCVCPVGRAVQMIQKYRFWGKE